MNRSDNQDEIESTETEVATAVAEPDATPLRVTALAGGIGGSKLLLGLSRVIDPAGLTIIANTGDDMEIFGLRICPDLDTITYTLSGVVNAETGWGISDDTFHCLRWIQKYGLEGWFNLGDRDLATHIFRTHLLRKGTTLAEVTERIRLSLGVQSRIIPMCNEYNPTYVVTDDGEMHLQEYFVKKKCEPAIREIRLSGAAASSPAPGVESAIAGADAVILCPSNPFISIAPILAVPGLRKCLSNATATVAAVSPVVGGFALKGPTAEMMRDLGHEVSAVGVARLYGDFVDVFVIDERDDLLAPRIEDLGMRVVVADTIMGSIEEKERLARVLIQALDLDPEAP